MNLKFSFKTKDFVLLGIMVAMYFVLYMVIGFLIVFILPGLSYFIAMPIMGIFNGVVITFVFYKIPKMWVLTLFSLILLLIFTLLGMMYLPMFISVILGAIIGDFIANLSAYKSRFKNAIAYGLSVLGMAGSMVFTIWYSTSYYTKTVLSVGATPEMVNLAIKASAGLLGVFTLAIAFFGAFFGIYLGYAVLEKHFNKQEN